MRRAVSGVYIGKVGDAHRDARRSDQNSKAIRYLYGC
jgi:hypothetical protein